MSYIKPIPRYSYVEGEMLEVSDGEWVRVADLPFKVGRAYMLVPRCETCLNWDSKHGKRGICKFLGEMTSVNFGCVKWNEAPDANLS